MMRQIPDIRTFIQPINISSFIVFLFAAVLYCITADSSVSYWDCPEYVIGASLLEVGHSPGNPIWMLAMRVATLPFSPEHHAYVINICSALFMAAASALTARIIFMLLIFTAWLRNPHTIKVPPLIAVAASVAGGCSFAACDSAWYSAVEAEVYAFSAFLTALVIWIMLKWAFCHDTAKRYRLLILIAYITGLSLGVHQLNLLVIPVLGLIYVFRTHPVGGRRSGAWMAVLLSFVAVGVILAVVMPGLPALAGALELLTVDRWGLPYNSGPIALILLLIAIAAGAGWLLQRMSARGVTLWWMGMLLIAGYFSFALVMVRASAAPPLNVGAPDNIFALQRYIAREQYGSTPLIYGATPFSRPIFKETYPEGSDRPVYTRYALKQGHPLRGAALRGGRLYHRSGMLTHSDSLHNSRIAETGHGYMLTDYTFSRITTPELDMWFPRITSQSPRMLDSYESWTGMNTSNMTEVEVSEAVDSAGNHVARMGRDGERHRTTSYRPTYLQNLQMLLSYQVYYMYVRYLLWNFIGRQNDIPSTGEIDHGNFITGIPAVDTLMVGRQDLLPAYASADNPGRHIYYGIPFLLGVAGMIFLCCGGRAGRRTMAIITMFFLMTGLAIVVYLNQSPGEPRERDYAFLGSYMAFCIWIGFGVAGVAKGVWRLTRRPLPAKITATAAALAPIFIMTAANLPDHDRSGRMETRAFATAMMRCMPDGIIFTYGDNFSFPLWYASEMEREGQSTTIVDISYLSTPEYVVNLMKQGDRGLRLTASAADIAYGAYAFTKVADDADPTPIPLREVLRNLYAGREGEPVLRHSRGFIARPLPGDTLTIDLKEMAGASKRISFRDLMLLDILATNLDSPSPRPLYFMSHLPADFHSILKGKTRVTAFADMYAPFMDDAAYRNMLQKTPGVITDAFRMVNRKPHYIDPVLADQWRRQRGALLRVATALMENPEQGREEAAKVKGIVDMAVDSLYNPQVSLGSFTVADSTFHEGREASRLYRILADSLNEKGLERRAEGMLTRMRIQGLEWVPYWRSLPAERRHALSPDTRRKLSEVTKMREEGSKPH